MNTANDNQTHTLSLTRVFNAPIRSLFECFTDPALVTQWWGPKGTVCPDATNELRIGGDYRFVIEDTESGNRYISCGRYLVIEPPDRLVFSWYWESDPEDVSQVSIDFRALDEARRTTTGAR